MQQIAHFMRGFGLGIIGLVTNRLVFSGARTLGILGFFGLVAWQPHIFGHRFAPIIGVALIIVGGIVWRVWRSKKPLRQEKTGGGWRALGDGN